jgi:hypothetical protein
MMTQYPFLRRAELYVWPTAETLPNVPDGQAMRFVSDGTRNTFYLRFRIEQSIIWLPQQSEIVLKNLSAATRDALRTANLRVELRIGWEGQAMRSLFVGSLLQAITQREGPDLCTRLLCLTGAGALRQSVISQTYAPLTPVREVVTDLAARLPGITVDPARMATLRGFIGPGGYSTAGMVHQAWSIQNGTFQALADDGYFERILRISSDDRTLILATPWLFANNMRVGGVNIQAMLIPGLLPGDRIQLDSKVTPSLNGTRILHTVTYTGSPNENDWTMRILSRNYGDQGSGTI